jgi:hypothetical protein
MFLGVALALLGVLAVSELRSHTKLRSIEERLLPEETREFRPDCSQPDACLDKKYAANLLLAAKQSVTPDEAARRFCEQTTWPERTPADMAQVRRECETRTRDRMTLDLK